MTASTPTRSAAARQRTQTLIDQLGDPTVAVNRAQYMSAVHGCLMDLLPGDLIAWNDIVVPRQQVAVDTGPTVPRFPLPKLSSTMAELGLENPMVASYLDPADRGTQPRRLSDVIDQARLRRTRAYADLYRPMGARAQLTILTSRNRQSGSGRCWAINRSTGDFTDHELDLAAALQPVLALLDHAHPAPDTTRPANPPGELTARELSVLTLLARGLTAVQISRILLISPSTARKHIEHIYAKLNVHDRLIAVDVARRHGILPPPDTPTSGPTSGPQP